ncbi:hypothetical protein AM228_23340 [Planktothricoides sp. SR001]|nr:hypothetical protein AM228_23340 [Planktothricoides sp. SR001]
MNNFSSIEPTSQSENLSGSINLKNGRDLAASFEKAKNPGEKVELFFAVAENQPEVAVPAFVEILETQAKQPIRALALQGLGRIRDPHIKQALAACDTEEDLQVLRDVANEVKGKGEVSGDLTRWAAAWAIENIGFSQDAIPHLEGGALTEPPYRIRNEIIGRKLQEIGRIQILDSRNEVTPEYEINLEFWLYGPTEELFRANFNLPQYQTLVGDVIYFLNVRGIELAIDKDRSFLQIDDERKRRWLQEQALRIAGSKFAEFTEFEQKRAYKTIEDKDFLSNDYNQDIPLRNLAAQAIKQAGSWLDPSIRSRSFVICEEWEKAVAIGEPALAHLQEVIERKLKLTTSENELRQHQIKALETILAIFDKNYTEISASNHQIVDCLLLTEFLSNNYNNNISWRKSAAQAIKQAGSWLYPSIRARSFVICEQWQQVAAIGEPAVSHLEEVIERNLRLAASEDEIINQQIKAVETINQIQFAELSEKIKKLVKVLLLCPEEQVRKATARLLEPHKGVVPNIANLVDALLFEYTLEKPELKDLTVPQMDERLSSCREKESVIATTFANAIAEANSLARTYSKSTSAAQEFLQNKQEAYLSDIRGWITQLEKQIAETSRYQKKIKYYQESLKDALSEIRGIDSELYKELMAVPKQTALNSTEYQTYNQCQNLSPDLEYIKSQFVPKINQGQAKLNKKSKERFEAGLWGMGIGVAIILFMTLVIDYL